MNLIDVGDGYALVFEASETKNHQALEFPIGDTLLPYLDRFLEHIRPVFLGAAGHNGLWPSAKGGPLGAQAIYQRIVRRTEAAFGYPVNPHRFRDSAATTIALRDGANILVARDLLGHSSLATTERHYNRARASRRRAQDRAHVESDRGRHVHIEYEDTHGGTGGPP